MSRVLANGLLSLALVISLAQAADAGFRETFEKTVPIPPNGRLSVENVDGSIDVTVWDRDAVHVRAIKKARDSDRLADIEIEIEQSGDHVGVRTRNRHRRSWLGIFGNWFHDGKGEVEYEIQVPSTVELDRILTVNGSVHICSAGNGVRAEVVNGALTLKDVSGPLRLSTVNGSLKISLADLGDSGGASIQTVNGSIRLVLPADSNASLSVKSINGSIDTDLERGRIQRYLVGRSLHAELGTGEAPIHVKTVNGSVSIRTEGDIRSASR